LVVYLISEKHQLYLTLFDCVGDLLLYQELLYIEGVSDVLERKGVEQWQKWELNRARQNNFLRPLNIFHLDLVELLCYGPQNL
jgi:hypothetical protein